MKEVNTGAYGDELQFKFTVLTSSENKNHNGFTNTLKLAREADILLSGCVISMIAICEIIETEFLEKTANRVILMAMQPLEKPILRKFIKWAFLKTALRKLHRGSISYEIDKAGLSQILLKLCANLPLGPKEENLLLFNFCMRQFPFARNKAIKNYYFYSHQFWAKSEIVQHQFYFYFLMISCGTTHK